MKKGMRERISGGDVCDCCFGEQAFIAVAHLTATV
jgi:hypothetical protein